jgi:hypothetical protein
MMANSDEIFLAFEGELGAAAARVARVLELELEFNGDLRDETGELQYKGRGRTSDGDVGVYIGPNSFSPSLTRCRQWTDTPLSSMSSTAP